MEEQRPGPSNASDSEDLSLTVVLDDRKRSQSPPSVLEDDEDSYANDNYNNFNKTSVVLATATNMALLHLFISAALPVFSKPLFSFYRMVFGTLYPAYASYKAVKTKNVKEYVKWMMYWIVFALFSCVETFADMLVSFWLPFYYEMKILFLVWLLSPATKGSSILYRKFVHPKFNKHEREIDEYISRARDQGYSTVLQLGHKGLQYATTVVMQTALKGQETLVSHLKKSYSMTDLSGPGLLRPSLQYSATLPEVDNQLDELDETGSNLSHRWQSDGELMYADQSHSADESHSRSPSRYRSKEPSSDTGSLRRTRSVRATRSNPLGGGDPPTRTSPTSLTTTTRSRSSLQQPDDSSVYATLPRTKTKVTRKKTSKTN